MTRDELKLAGKWLEENSKVDASFHRSPTSDKYELRLAAGDGDAREYILFTIKPEPNHEPILGLRSLMPDPFRCDTEKEKSNGQS